MPLAARLTDFHACPMSVPNFELGLPHDGGPTIGPLEPQVLIDPLPAAEIGDTLVCVGPPDSMAPGSATVLSSGIPAGRLGDTTAHGGGVPLGSFSAMLGS